MIREAIDRILGLSHATLDVAKEAHVLGDQLRVEDMEKYHAFRRRFRGTFQTSLMSGFVDYCGHHGDGTEAVFVDPDSMSAKAIFDAGNPAAPGHCEHVAKLKLEATAPYAAWHQICQKQISQRDLREFVADWVEHIEDGEHLYRAVSTVTVDGLAKATSTVGQFSQKRTALEEYNVAGEVSLPEIVNFECEPYPGFDSFTFQARLHAHTDGSKVVFSLVRSKALEERQDLAEMFAEALIAKLGGEESGAIVGTFSS